MGLSSIAIKEIPTSYTITGGTALSLSPLQNDWDTLLLGVSTDADLRTRRTYQFDITNPKVSSAAPNGYTQQRFKAFVKRPKILANGKITVNTVKIEFAMDVETTDAEKTALMDDVVQMFIDANTRTAVKRSTTA